MAGSNYTLAAALTVWTTAPGISGNGLTFETRKTIPTDILSITLNADATYTQVHETASGAMVLGNNTVAACTLSFYGTFLTVGQNNLFTDLLPGGANVAIRCAIGGTTGFKEGKHWYFGNVLVSNLDIGQDASGSATSSIASNLFFAPGFWYNCNIKKFSDHNIYISAGTWKSCIFNGQNNGAGYAITGSSTGAVTLVACTQKTSGAYWFYSNQVYTSVPVINIIGGITRDGSGGTQINFVAQSGLIVNFFRRSFVKLTSDGSTAISGASYSAYEATGGVDMPLSSGVTGSGGLMKPQSPTIYNDSVWALQKVETYIRTTAGAMTWGTPTSTTTYGNYTFLFWKSGYNAQTATHDFTDGLDWGTSTTPIAITMTKPSAIPSGSNSVPLATFSDAACTVESSTFQVGATVYANADVALKSIGTDTRSALTTIKVYRKSDNALIATLYNDTDTLTGGTVYSYKDSSLFGNGTAYNFSTVGYTPGEYYVQISTSGTDITTQTNTEYFVVTAVGTSPVITAPSISAASITESEDFTITAICTNAPTTFKAVINGKAYPMVRIGTTTTYSALVNGRAVGGLDVAHTIFLAAENAYGSDTDSTLTVTVSTVTTNPVTLVLGHLNASWNAGTVTKPRLVDGGTDGGRYSAQDGDVVKAYKSRRPPTRTPHVEQQRRETREDFVTLDIYTAQGRARMDLLQGEIERVLNSVSVSPGGGYRKLWANGMTTPAEYPDLIRGMIDVELWKIMKITAT